MYNIEVRPSRKQQVKIELGKRILQRSYKFFI